MEADVVEAIADLWPLALILVGGIAIFLFRRQLGELLNRLTKFSFRHGETHLDMDAAHPPLQEPPPREGEQQVAPPDDLDEERLLEAHGDGESSTKDGAGKSVIELLREGNIAEARRQFLTPQDELTGNTAGAEESSDQAKEALFLALAFVYGNDEASIEELRRRAADGSDEEANVWLAFVLAQLGEYEQAFAEYGKAAAASKDLRREALHIRNAGEALGKLGQFERAELYLRSAIAERSDSHQKATLYRGLATIYQGSSQYELRALALERAIELNPEATGLRFDAGYAYTHVDDEHPVGLLHYVTKSYVDEDDAATLNNLGVILERLDLNIKSIEKYQQALAKGNSLAGANLANRLIDVGFNDEAERVLEEASRKDSVHENVGKAVGTLASKRESEDNRLDDLLASARQQQSYLRRYAVARFEVDADADFSGTWMYRGYSIKVEQDAASLAAEWMAGNNRHRLTGTVIGGTAAISFEEMGYFGSEPRVEIGFKKAAQAKAFMSDDAHTIHLLEIRDGDWALLDLPRRPDTA